MIVSNLEIIYNTLWLFQIEGTDEGSLVADIRNTFIQGVNDITDLGNADVSEVSTTKNNR